MKQGVGPGITILVILIVAAAAGGGYWAGSHQSAGHEASTEVSAADSSKKERKILFYRNPMGLPDTSPTPKKDSMGMDYIPVYEGEDDEEPDAANQVRISTEKIQKLGVRTEVASLRTLDKIVRAAGRIDPDERRNYTISPKFEGYIERLHVNTTGQAVAKGQPLFEVYSPELVSAQREYLIAAQGVKSLSEAGKDAQAGIKQLADSSLARLKNWDISEEQLKALVKSDEVRRTLTFRSPVNGLITEKKALQGMRFVPGDPLYQVTDLSSVWVIANVFEQDIGLIKTGAKALIKINAYPDKPFEGVITYIYPTLEAETRTIPVRIELPNPGALLKPGMFAQVELPVSNHGAVVTVPISAVIDSGVRQIVLVEAKEGRYEPREVKLGARSDNHVEIIQGVKEGEAVVVKANFLIDAESNLKAAFDSFGQRTTEVKKTSIGHHAEGTVDDIDTSTGTVIITHGPVASLKWPAMTMEFKVANEALLKTMMPGKAINFEFVERGQSEWVITSLTPDTRSGTAHSGHPTH